jgi:hypothetical protein
VLEVGVLDEQGRFRAECQIGESASFKHVAIEAGGDGSVWLAYTNAAGTWVEQRSGAP